MSTNPRTNASSLLILRSHRPSSARLIHQVSQETLEELVAKRARAREAGRDLEEAEHFIATALRSGASVEPGARKAELKRVRRESFRVKPIVYYRLSVR